MEEAVGLIVAVLKEAGAGEAQAQSVLAAARTLGVEPLLGRLLAKEAVAHEEDGRRYRYRPLVAREDYVVGESQRLIDRLFGGSLTPLVAHLARRDQLSSREIEEIESLLKELKQ